MWFSIQIHTTCWYTGGGKALKPHPFPGGSVVAGVVEADVVVVVTGGAARDGPEVEQPETRAEAMRAAA